MTRRTQRADNHDALAAFFARKTEIDAILARLQALSAEHFGAAPDDITWGHVGTLGFYAEHLREVSNIAIGEGEYAA